MGKQRFQRVAGEIKKEISEILRLELKDPGLMELISVMAVEVSRDLGLAKVYVSVYGDAGEKEKALKILDKAKGFVRHEIGKRIRLRHIPEIEFHLDRTLEYSARIEGVLKELGLDTDTGVEKNKDE
ncbi:MAG: 30S ribosome-binding factor RbfA [Firmicutes bacterium]|nr:30S ribosome-binding factor RbfA [Bacillota bacterium]